MKTIEIKVPDSFTEEQEIRVKEYAVVQMERIIRATEIPPVEVREANDKIVKDIRVEMGLVKESEEAEIIDEPIKEGGDDDEGTGISDTE
jgi:hypothetical protein